MERSDEDKTRTSSFPTQPVTTTGTALHNLNPIPVIWSSQVQDEEEHNKSCFSCSKDLLEVRDDEDVIPYVDGGSPCSIDDAFTLFDLAWEDILFGNLLPYLSWQDLFRLRRVSWQSKALVDDYFSNLKTVHIVSRNFSSKAFQRVTGSCAKIRRLTVLENGWIRDGELSSVFSRNPSLTYLDLTGCASLTGTCLLTLSVKCKMLKTLILRDCNWITRGALETLMSHLTSLEEIDLSSCSALSNPLIISFIQRFPLLRIIHLAHIRCVNDSTLISISRGCSGLIVLDIRACMGVTDSGIRSIAEYCPKLTSISVAHCHLVTEYSLALLRARGDVWIDRQISSARVPCRPPLMVQV